MYKSAFEQHGHGCVSEYARYAPGGTVSCVMLPISLVPECQICATKSYIKLGVPEEIRRKGGLKYLLCQCASYSKIIYN